MSVPTSAEVVFDQIFYSLIIGVSVVFLLGHKLGGSNRFVTFLLALGVMMILWSVGAMSYIGIEFSNNMFVSIVYFASLALAILLGIVLAGWFCRKRYSWKRFLSMLVLGCIITGVMLLFSFFVVYTIFESGLRFQLALFIQIPIVGAVLGFISYIIILPYMILAFRSGFFRERLYSCLRLESMGGRAEAGAESKKVEEEDPGVKIPENDNFA